MRAFLGVVMLLFGLLGLGVSLCGAIFTFSSLTGEARGMLVIAVPSLLIGLGVTYGCCRAAVALFADHDPPPP